jgi:hypothetical protein
VTVKWLLVMLGLIVLVLGTSLLRSATRPDIAINDLLMTTGSVVAVVGDTIVWRRGVVTIHGWWRCWRS